MHKVVIFLVVADKIIMVIAPYHCVGTDTKVLFLSHDLVFCFVETPFAIDEIDSSARLYCSADNVDIIIDLFIEALVAFLYINLSFQHCCLRFTAESAYLFDKLLGLFRRDEISCLDSVYEKSELGKLEVSCAYTVAGLGISHRYDINTGIFKGLYVGIN